MINNQFLCEKFGGKKTLLYLCTTRTRQASQRCSNVRVVLFLYYGQKDSFPEILFKCGRTCDAAFRF